jgi:hypothetical protein
VQMLRRSIIYLLGRNPALPFSLFPFPKATCLFNPPTFCAMALWFARGGHLNTARTRGQL